MSIEKPINRDNVFEKVPYVKLNSKQKENYNFHIVAAKLAAYGYNSMRLNDDWQGADFISIHIDGNEMLKVQLREGLRYLQKDIWIAFVEDGMVKIFEHDLAIPLLKENTLKSESWSINGQYSWKKTPKIFDEIITIL